jgi:hypothetical protein
MDETWSLDLDFATWSLDHKPSSMRHCLGWYTVTRDYKPRAIYYRVYLICGGVNIIIQLFIK